MRSVANYELVLSGENPQRLLLTFDWSDLPALPKNVLSVVCDHQNLQFKVEFEDQQHWEEVAFVEFPQTLLDIVDKFQQIVVVGLSDQVEMFVETDLTHQI